MAAHKYLHTVMGFSAKKIAIMGGSFGGYASAESIVQYPNNFCATSVEYAVFDIVQQINDGPSVYKNSQLETIGNPVADKDRLLRASPMSKVHQVQTPMLIVFGEEDKVVLSSQSERFVEKMSDSKKDFQVIVYNTEGHGISGFTNFRYYQKEVSNFFRKYCK